jgi:hypothetical protein
MMPFAMAIADAVARLLSTVYTTALVIMVSAVGLPEQAANNTGQVRHKSFIALFLMLINFFAFTPLRVLCRLN